MTNLILRFDPTRVSLPHNVEMFIEVEKIARSIQKLETIISVLILAFKTEEIIIYPLIGHLDECTRIIEKYIRLNVVYKLVYGCNFLSKLKTVYARIENLIDSSRSELNSNGELLDEFRRTFPHLVYAMFDSFFMRKYKAAQVGGEKVGRVESVESLVDQALYGIQEMHRF